MEKATVRIDSGVSEGGLVYSLSGSSFCFLFSIIVFYFSFLFCFLLVFLVINNAINLALGWSTPTQPNTCTMPRVD